MRTFILALASIVLLAGCAQTATQQQVAAALRENPQLVYDALKQDKNQLLDLLDQALAERETQEQRQRMAQNLANPLTPDLGGDRLVFGPANAPITIVEYSDFLCPYCGRGTATVMELVRRNPGKIRLIHKHYPLKPGSVELAAMFEALGMQKPELAWQFAELAYANQSVLADKDGNGVAALLASMNADYKKLKKDSESKKVLARIEADVREARKFGVEGTPSFLVNGVFVRGAVPIEDFEALIRVLEAKK